MIKRRVAGVVAAMAAVLAFAGAANGLTEPPAAHSTADDAGWQRSDAGHRLSAEDAGWQRALATEATGTVAQAPGDDAGWQ